VKDRDAASSESDRGEHSQSPGLAPAGGAARAERGVSPGPGAVKGERSRSPVGLPRGRKRKTNGTAGSGSEDSNDGVGEFMLVGFLCCPFEEVVIHKDRFVCLLVHWSVLWYITKT